MSIQLINVGKTYDNQKWALRNVNITIHSGEFFVVVGPSGGGKSTLLNMIAGLLPVSSGKIRIDDRDVTNLPPKDRQLTMVFQSYALFPFLNVIDNVAFGLKARKLPKNEIKERVDQALDMTGLEEFKTRYPRELSGGQRQRVAIARAVASEAKICLMDEPLSNLDAQLRGKMRTQIRRLQQKLGLTMIYVTHDQIEAMTMADRIMVINHHRVQQVGTPREIYQHPANSFVASFFGTPPMNLVDVKLTSPSQKFEIEPMVNLSVNKVLPAGQYQIGIRPQNVLLEPVQDQLTGNGAVLNAQYQGDRQVVEIQMNNNTRLLAISSQESEFKPHQSVLVTIRPAFYVFDQDGQLCYEGGVSNEKITPTI